MRVSGGSILKKFFKSLLIILILALAVSGIWYFQFSKRNAERLEQADPIDAKIQQVMNGENWVPSEEIPDFLKEATVSVEDSRFYIHHGIDVISLSRAVFSQLIPGMEKSGGSTISQQVVKNLYGMYGKGLPWKGTEILMALDLEKKYSKDEILTIYLNIINYGDRHFGIGEASSGYFMCLPMQLDQAECSLLAGIPQSPSAYQLSDHYQQAKWKQKVVLDSMVRNDMITQTEADQIYQTPIYYVANGYWNEGLGFAFQSPGFKLEAEA